MTIKGADHVVVPRRPFHLRSWKNTCKQYVLDDYQINKTNLALMVHGIFIPGIFKLNSSPTKFKI